MSSDDSDDKDGRSQASLDRTTRILAQLETELTRSRRELALMWCGLEQRRRATSDGLPAAPAGDQAPEPPAALAPTSEEGRTQPGGGVDVLIVDDDRELCAALGEVLAEHGYRAVPVFSGAAALAYLRDHARPSAVVLDLMMPETPGLAVLRCLSEAQSIGGPEVIVFTAAGSDYVRQAGIDPDLVVRKPFLPVLLDRLALALGPR